MCRETDASPAAGRPARVPRDLQPASAPPATVVGAAAPLLWAPYRLRVSPGRRSQARLRSAETASQPLHDPHQCQNEASEAPPLSILLEEVGSFVSKPGRPSLQTHTPFPALQWPTHHDPALGGLPFTAVTLIIAAETSVPPSKPGSRKK